MLRLNNNSITSELPTHTAAMSVYPYSVGLEAAYTFTTAYDEVVCGAIRKGNSLLVPRESVPYALPPNDFRVSHPPSAISCIFKPRHNQGELCQKSIQLLREGKNHIFEAATGYGKTVVASYIASQIGQPTLIIVSKQDLMDQWKDTLLKLLQIDPSLVGQIQQDRCQWEGKMFVLGMAQSLIIPDRYPEEMYRYFGMVIWDEVHLMATEGFIKACQLFPAKYRLGVSATPTRKDGKTKLLDWHIGPTLVKGTLVSLPPKVLVKKTSWKLPQVRVKKGNAWTYDVIPHSPGRMMTVNKAQASSTSRNQEIVDFVLQAYNADRRILILSDLKEYHLDRLFQHLCSEGIPGNEIGYYVGGLSKEQLNYSKIKRIVLGTYKMCSTGTDVPEWDTLVMATPRSDIKQIIGRVMREKEGKKQPVVLDLVDHDSIFQGFHQSRLKQYRSVGASIVNIT